MPALQVGNSQWEKSVPSSNSGGVGAVGEVGGVGSALGSSGHCRSKSVSGQSMVGRVKPSLLDGVVVLSALACGDSSSEQPRLKASVVISNTRSIVFP